MYKFVKKCTLYLHSLHIDLSSKKIPLPTFSHVCLNSVSIFSTLSLASHPYLSFSLLSTSVHHLCFDRKKKTFFYSSISCISFKKTTRYFLIYYDSEVKKELKNSDYLLSLIWFFYLLIFFFAHCFFCLYFFYSSNKSKILLQYIRTDCSVIIFCNSFYFFYLNIFCFYLPSVAFSSEYLELWNNSIYI